MRFNHGLVLSSPSDQDHDGRDDGGQEDETSENAQRDDSTCQRVTIAGYSGIWC